MSTQEFVNCTKCSKHLIVKRSDGLWYFSFGKPHEGAGEVVPVEMYISGSLKIKCIRKSCGHWNVLTAFPV